MQQPPYNQQQSWQNPGSYPQPPTPVPPQPPRLYPHWLLVVLSILYILFWVLCFIGEATSPNQPFTFVFNLGISLFFGILVCVFIMDWRGAVTVQGMIHWQKRGILARIILGYLCLVVSPFLMAVYLIRTFGLYRNVPRLSVPAQHTSPRRLGKPLIGFAGGSVAALVSLIVLSMGVVGAGNTSFTPNPTPTSGQVALIISPAATHIPTPVPTPQPTIAPTHAPVQSQPPQPTPPSCQAIYGNPWCYNFVPGNLIYSPPSGFCTYFTCIPTFVEPDDPGDGYIVQCGDGLFSQSGGERGACSYHKGVMRPLYSH